LTGVVLNAVSWSPLGAIVVVAYSDESSGCGRAVGGDVVPAGVARGFAAAAERPAGIDTMLTVTARVERHSALMAEE